MAMALSLQVIESLNIIIPFVNVDMLALLFIFSQKHVEFLRKIYLQVENGIKLVDS